MALETITRTAEKSSLMTIFRELWAVRALVVLLSLREIKIRYKQTFLGFVWAVLTPFVLMVVFSLIFGGLAKMPSDGAPYPVFVFAGLLPWQLFSRTFSEIANSFVANAALIKKSFTPRLVFPVSSAFSGLVDFFVALVVFAFIVFYFDVIPGKMAFLVLVLPFYIVFVAFSAGLWLAVINVEFRDVRYVVPFAVQLWFFATPVVYPTSVVGEPWRSILALNPLVPIIESFRWAVLDVSTPRVFDLAISFAVTAVMMVTGLWLYRKRVDVFADRL